MSGKIGFIDLFIDEFHANNYPKWIEESSKKKDFELAYAWEERPNGEGRSLSEWCAEYGAEPLESIEELVDKSDAVFVLAPRNPEVHQRLAEIPLASGKPVYVDKPFAPTAKIAEEIFDWAEKHGTPIFSSSALRFSPTLREAINEKLKDGSAGFATTAGGGSSFEEYAIHQIEMLVMCAGVGAKRVMQCGTKDVDHMVVGYDDGRSAAMTLMPGRGFQAAFSIDGEGVEISSMGDFFPGLIDAVLEFFDTGIPPVPKEETIEIASILETGITALKTPGEWVAL
jgi:hypothetical protein